MIENENDLKKIITAAACGDRVSFGVLYEEYFSPIYRFVYFKIKHKEEAEDLTQTVFFKALRAMDRYEMTEVPFRAWLYQIAQNTVKDFWKKKKDIILNDPDTFFSQLSEGPGLLEEKHKEEEIQFILSKVNELSEDHKEIIIMHSIEGLSYSEIKDITGKNEESLRALKYRAMKLLKKNFEKDERI